MSATRILWGQVLIVALIALISVWAATQWTAWRLAYQPELGAPWFVFADHPIYAPPAFFVPIRRRPPSLAWVPADLTDVRKSVGKGRWVGWRSSAGSSGVG
ncbi:hypothetical protein, partial [Roseomonas chloroacetimidivorans]|uniref:hypothetical protein n=1 Tax=Roseomonas chloroacetimidivorans TaxID=1766656 RepID=UPI003C7307B5